MCGGNKRQLKEKQECNISDLQIEIRMLIQEMNCNIEMEQLKIEIANELIDFINILLKKIK